MTALFTQLFWVSLAGGGLIAAVLLLRLPARRAPRWVAPLLWGLVALRLCCPFFIESALSPLPAATRVTTTAPAAPITSQEPVAVSPAGDDDTVPVTSITPDVPSATAPTPSTARTPSAADIAAWVWAAGVLVMAGSALISWGRLRRRVAASVPLSPGVRQCDAIDSPFVTGLRRPCIYLPFSLAQDDIPYVLAHEQAHIRRHDLLWKRIGYILLIVYWFHPLVWVGYRMFCRDLELACDERATAAFDHKARGEYARALLACAAPSHPLRCPLAFGETGVKQRVRAVLSSKKPLVWVAVVALAAGVIAAVALLLSPPATYNGVTAGRYDGDFGVTLKLTDADLTAGNQSLTVRWRGRLPGVTYGSSYAVEKKVDGGWQELPTDPPNVAFTMEAYTLPVPGMSVEETYHLSSLYGDLPDGDYRLVTYFSVLGGKDRTASLPFAITGATVATGEDGTIPDAADDAEPTIIATMPYQPATHDGVTGDDVPAPVTGSPSGTVDVSVVTLNPTAGEQSLSVLWNNQTNQDVALGLPFSLKQKAANGAWETVTPKENARFDMIAMMVKSGGSMLLDYDIDEHYGTLPPGEYLFCADYSDGAVTLPFTIPGDAAVESMTIVVLPSPPTCKTTTDPAVIRRVRELLDAVEKTPFTGEQVPGGWDTKIDFSNGDFITLGGGLLVGPDAAYSADTTDLRRQIREIYAELDVRERSYLFPSAGPASIQLTDADFTPGGQRLVFSVENPTDSELTYSEEFALERRTDKANEPIAAKAGFIEIARVVEPHSTASRVCEISAHFGDLTPGKYRLTFTYSGGKIGTRTFEWIFTVS